MPFPFWYLPSYLRSQLSLTDRSVEVTRETSSALGQGCRLGFLGTLHMDVFRQRLEDEHDANVIITAPTVPYQSACFARVLPAAPAALGHPCAEQSPAWGIRPRTASRSQGREHVAREQSHSLPGPPRVRERRPCEGRPRADSEGRDHSAGECVLRVVCCPSDSMTCCSL